MSSAQNGPKQSGAQSSLISAMLARLDLFVSEEKILACVQESLGEFEPSPSSSVVISNFVMLLNRYFAQLDYLYPTLAGEG